MQNFSWVILTVKLISINLLSTEITPLISCFHKSLAQREREMTLLFKFQWTCILNNLVSDKVVLISCHALLIIHLSINNLFQIFAKCCNAPCGQSGRESFVWRENDVDKCGCGLIVRKPIMLEEWMKHQLKITLPDKVMDDNVWDPEVLDDVRSDIDLSPGPICAVIENHPVLWPPHVVAQPHADLLTR